MVKKILLIIFLIFVSLPTLADGIGYIDYEQIVKNYKFAEITKQELDIKSQELKFFLEQKEKEYNLLETPVQKSKFENEMHSEILKREEAFNDFVKKRETAVKNRIQSAIEQVRAQKGLDAVLDAESIYSGGTDITKDIINILNQ